MNKPQSTSQMINTGLALVLIAIIVLAVQLIGTLRTHQGMSEDRAEINNVKYGMLNADVWVQQVTAIIEKKINEFELTPEKRGAVKATLERMLDVLVTEADRHMRKQTKKGNWWERTTSAVKQDVKDSFVDIEEIKAGIPQYADKILDEMNKPAGRRHLDGLVKDLLEDASSSTFSLTDESPIAAVHARYNCEDQLSCGQSINQEIASNHERAVQQTLMLLALTVALFVGVCAAPGKSDNNRLAMLALCCATLMLCGVLTPMIEIEARISELRFALLGEPVVFTDQVLYFQSKSVLDVVQILTSTGKLEMILVGVLVMVFSVAFPLAKLAASFVYLYDLKGMRKSPITRFFALKSGKWSMADVFVVAMFMAYIGFNGMLSSQLSKFAAAGGKGVDVLTTNGTELQIGFFMFLAFCLASLLTSTLIDARSEMKSARESPQA